MDNQTLLTIFVALTGLAVLMQACVLIAIYVGLRKTAKAVSDGSQEFKTTILPMVNTTRELLERITPQIVTLTEGLADLSNMLHSESKSVRLSVSEIMDRVNRQSARIDSMLTVGLDTVERAGTVVETAVAQPVRQAHGIMAGIKAAIASYRSSNASRYSERYPDPDDPDEAIFS